MIKEEKQRSSIEESMRDQEINTRASKLVLVVLSVLIVGLSIAFALNSTTGIMGYTTRLIVSGSMVPNININDFVIVEICDIEDVEIGDIVCYNNGVDIVHRVTDINSINGELLLTTKGDANRNVDNINVDGSKLVGKVVKILNWHKVLNPKLSLDNKGTLGVLLFVCVIGVYIILRLCKKIGLFGYILKKEIDKEIKKNQQLSSADKAKVNTLSTFIDILSRAKSRYLRLKAVRDENNNSQNNVKK